jgi:hypothetical protein
VTAAKQVTTAGEAVLASPAAPAHPAAPTALAAVRACYGAALLLAPGPLIRICTGCRADSRVRLTARVLGARHLVQAALTAGAGPAAGGLAASAAVDLMHAASMAGLAAASHSLRRTALTDAMLETALAAAGLVSARAQGEAPDARQGTRPAHEIAAITNRNHRRAPRPLPAWSRSSPALAVGP